MSHGVVVRRLRADDAQAIAAAFLAIGWSKPKELFDTYAREDCEGTRVCFVAEVDNTFAGYCTLEWASAYPPFKQARIPEVSDLNVLPRFRNLGIGNQLLDVVEATARERSSSVGLGVGLYADYGAAQRIYVRRGYVPDGRGIMYHYVPVTPGTEIRIDDDATLMMVLEFESQP